MNSYRRHLACTVFFPPWQGGMEGGCPLDLRVKCSKSLRHKRPRAVELIDCTNTSIALWLSVESDREKSPTVAATTRQLGAEIYKAR